MIHNLHAKWFYNVLNFFYKSIHCLCHQQCAILWKHTIHMYMTHMPRINVQVTFTKWLNYQLPFKRVVVPVGVVITPLWLIGVSSQFYRFVKHYVGYHSWTFTLHTSTFHDYSLSYHCSDLCDLFQGLGMRLYVSCMLAIPSCIYKYVNKYISFRHNPLLSL